MRIADSKFFLESFLLVLQIRNDITVISMVIYYVRYTSES